MRVNGLKFHLASGTFTMSDWTSEKVDSNETVGSSKLKWLGELNEFPENVLWNLGFFVAIFGPIQSKNVINI